MCGCLPPRCRASDTIRHSTPTIARIGCSWMFSDGWRTVPARRSRNEQLRAACARMAAANPKSERDFHRSRGVRYRRPRTGWVPSSVDGRHAAPARHRRHRPHHRLRQRRESAPAARRPTQNEIAVRRALGATAGRLIRRQVVEGLLLSVLGGVAGIALTLAFRAVLGGERMRGTPALAGVPMDWRVIGFALALSLLAGIIFAIVPALLSLRIDFFAHLKDTGGTGGSGLRLRRASWRSCKSRPAHRWWWPARSSGGRCGRCTASISGSTRITRCLFS